MRNLGLQKVEIFLVYTDSIINTQTSWYNEFMNQLPQPSISQIHFRELFTFLIVSSITSMVEFAVFAIGAYVLFVPFHSQSFEWWLISYPVHAGGFGTFLAFATSYIIAQIFNFIVQRKTTFRATNHVLQSAIMYAVMVLGIYLLQLILPPLILPVVINWVGFGVATFIVKSLMMTMAAVIQFPLNKWVIMRKDAPSIEHQKEGK